MLLAEAPTQIHRLGGDRVERFLREEVLDLVAFLFLGHIGVPRCEEGFCCNLPRGEAGADADDRRRAGAGDLLLSNVL